LARELYPRIRIPFRLRRLLEILAYALAPGIFPRSIERKGNVVVEYHLLPCNVSVGKGTYGLIRTYSYDENAVVSVGSFTSIASVTLLLGGGHHHRDVSSYPFRIVYTNRPEESSRSRGQIRIGNDVWIGHDVFVLDNVVIGDGAVLAAKSVVTRDVPPYAVVAGNPAVVKSYRFTPDDIQILIESQWWDMPDDLLKMHPDIFYDTDVERFASLIKSLRSSLDSSISSREKK